MGRKRKIDINSVVTNTNESSNSSGTSNLSIIQRSAANDRERTRMRVLSKAFVKLKTSLPWVPADTKLSKLDTLKLATSYISYLTKILQDDERSVGGSGAISTSEIFQSSSINFQKFNLNTRLFTNIRFSSNEKHKKIIEHLSSSSSNNLQASNSTTPYTPSCNNTNICENDIISAQNDYVIYRFFLK